MTTGILAIWKNYALNKKLWEEMINKVVDIKIKIDFLAENNMIINNSTC